MNFTIAHTEKFKDSQGNMQDKTIWVDCSYWSDRTAVSQYLVKGKQVYVDGQPEVRTYTKNDGGTGVSLTLRVREVQLLGGRADSGGAPAMGGEPSRSSIPNAADVNEPIDDLPF
jgi:single-strand DNA-binding protein